MSRVPNGWGFLKLGNIISLEYGKSLPEKARNQGEVNVYGSNGVVGYHDFFLCKGPGIIVGRKGSAGTIIWAENNYWAIDTTYYVKNKIKNDLKWLFYTLSNLDFDKINQKSSVPGLNREDAYIHKILLPPLPEQKKIAEILASVDKAIQSTQAVIEQTKKVKQGLMQELLTRGIGHIKFKRVELNGKMVEVPEEWEVKELGDVVKLASGKTKPSNIFAKQTSECQIPVYGGNGIMGYTNIPLIKQATIIIGRVGEYCGAIHFPPNDSWITDNALYICENKIQYIISFLFFLLQEMNLSQYRNKGGQPLISQGILNPLTALLPPLSEQKKIAEILTSVDDSIQSSQDKLAQLQTLKKGLMQDLLTGKVRVTIKKRNE